MLKRENGWALSDTNQDIWREVIDGKRRRYYKPSVAHFLLIRVRYINNITGDILDSIPVQFRGGLLSDPIETVMSKRKTTLLVAPSTRGIKSF